MKYLLRQARRLVTRALLVEEGEREGGRGGGEGGGGSQSQNEIFVMTGTQAGHTCHTG